MARDPGDDKVTDATRAAEAEDEQVTAGPDRAPNPDEEAAAERAEPVSDETRAAYEEMAERGAHQKGEGRI